MLNLHNKRNALSRLARLMATAKTADALYRYLNIVPFHSFDVGLIRSSWLRYDILHPACSGMLPTFTRLSLTVMSKTQNICHAKCHAK